MTSSWRRCQTYYSANRIITCNKSLDLLTLKKNCVLVSGFSYKDFHSFGGLHHFEVDINNLKLWSIMKCVSYACIAFWDDFKTITMLVHELKWTLELLEMDYFPLIASCTVNEMHSEIFIMYIINVWCVSLESLSAVFIQKTWVTCTCFND